MKLEFVQSDFKKPIMAWLLNREETHEYVIRLYKENRSIREIAKLVHMSFRDKAAIINRMEAEVQTERYATDEIDSIINRSRRSLKASDCFRKGRARWR